MQSIDIDWARVLCPEDVDAWLRKPIERQAFNKMTAGYPVEEPAESTKYLDNYKYRAWG